MLGECTHPHIKGLIIQRHNTATQHIAQAIRQSPLQTIQAYLWMDAGKDVSPHLQDGGHTLPSWLLPNLDNTQRRQFRPDILYIPGWNGDIPTIINRITGPTMWYAGLGGTSKHKWIQTGPLTKYGAGQCKAVCGKQHWKGKQASRGAVAFPTETQPLLPSSF